MANVITQDAEDILDLYFPVLDNGFIVLKGYFGGDESIVEAARNSYAKGTKKVSDDKALIRRLMRDRHTSPFEFVELKFHVRAPLYVIQQWLRHRTSNFCQESHRFSEVKDDFQVTAPNAWRLQDKNNKQGSSGFLRTQREPGQDYEDYWDGEELTEEEAHLHTELKKTYRRRIDAGIAREQARKDIPHSAYSSLYVKCDLHNILHFLKLRTDKHAQQEIRDFADLIAAMVKRVCPLTFDAWVDYAYAAKSFSRLDILMLNYMHRNYSVNNNNLQGTSLEDWEFVYKGTEDKYHEEIGMTKAEFTDFWTKLKPVEIPSFDLDLTKAKRME